MDLGTLSTALIVSVLVLLFFSLRTRIFTHCHEKNEGQQKKDTCHEPGTEHEARRRSDYYHSMALCEYNRRCEEMRHHK